MTTREEKIELMFKLADELGFRVASSLEDSRLCRQCGKRFWMKATEHMRRFCSDSCRAKMGYAKRRQREPNEEAQD